MTTQDTSSYEGAEENTTELVRQLSRFAFEDFPRVVDAMLPFVHRDRLMDAGERER